MKSILVIGSTGNVGRAIIANLAPSGEPVRTATRNPGHWKDRAGVEPVRFDYADAATFEPAPKGADRVFILGPPTPTPHEVVLPFVEAAAPAHSGLCAPRPSASCR